MRAGFRAPSGRRDPLQAGAVPEPFLTPDPQTRRRGLPSVCSDPTEAWEAAPGRLPPFCLLRGGKMCCEKWSQVAEMFLFIEDLEEDCKILCLCSRAFLE